MKTSRHFVIVLAATCHGLFALADTARVEVLVVDETTERPIKDVDVCGSFEIMGKPWDYVKGSPSPNFDYGRTDSQGHCKLMGKTNCGKVSCFLKSGPSTHYWMHRGGGGDFTSKNFFGVWQPDNLVVTIKLQRVEHPIPLFVKRVLLNVKQEIANINGGKFSYDLMMGEWLPPFGNGKVADVEFTRLPHKEFAEVVGASGIKGRPYRDDVAVRFMGEDNGLVECQPLLESVLKIRTAPEEGYDSDYLCWEGKGEDLQYSTNYDKNRCFAFRIRTQKDEKGQIKKAYYGKIYGDIVAYTGSHHAVLGVLFSYYLNPISLDRNLEWDRKTNLCPNPGDVGHSVGDRRP